MLYGDPGIIDPGIICFALFLSVYFVVCLTTRDLLTIMQLTLRHHSMFGKRFAKGKYIKFGDISCLFSHIGTHTWNDPPLTTASMRYGNFCFTVALCLVKSVASDANEHKDTYSALFSAV